MRREPDRSSEQVSQAVLGQIIRVLEQDSDWSRVRTADEYSGWIESRWLAFTPRGRSYAAAGMVARVTNLFADVLVWPDPASEIRTRAVIGTELEIAEVREDWVIVRLPDGTPGALRRFAVELVDRAVYSLPLTPTGFEIAATARRFVGSPYLWGGTTPFGFDCSGFAQLVYKLNGVLLPRDAHLQAQDQRFVPADGAARPGDLLFFFGPRDGAGSDKDITHVGLALGADRFIHSAGGAGVGVSDLQEPPYAETFKKARRLR